LPHAIASDLKKNKGSHTLSKKEQALNKSYFWEQIDQGLRNTVAMVTENILGPLKIRIKKSPTNMK
jgi:hypothetical protein